MYRKGILVFNTRAGEGALYKKEGGKKDKKRGFKKGRNIKSKRNKKDIKR